MQLSTSCLGISGLLPSAACRLQLPRHGFAVCRRGLFKSNVTLHEDETSQARSFPSAVESQPERKPVKQAEFVVPGDLLATLAAHRESNSLRRHLEQVDGAEKTNTAVKDGMKTVHAEESGEKPAKNVRVPIIRPRNSTRLSKEKLFQVVKAKSTQNHGLAIIDPKQYSNGTYVRTSKYQGTSPRPYQPWKRALRDLKFVDRHERLHKEIEEFDKWMTLDSWEVAVRQHMIDRVVALMQKPLKDGEIKFEVFGSHVTGLATPASDLDIGFQIPVLQKKPDERGPSPSRPEGKRHVRAKLDKMCQISLSDPEFMRQEIVGYARYPLLRMQHHRSKISIQIVSSGAQTTVVEYVKNYLDEFPNLKPIYMVIKAALAARGLDEPRTGGLGSYPLLVMIIASFKLGPSLRTDDLGRALLVFLKFYNQLNPRVHCVCIDPPMVFRKSKTYLVWSAKEKAAMRENLSLYWRHKLSVVREDQPWLLCLQDPADMTNDLCKGVYRIMDIRLTFRYLANDVEEWLNGDTKSPSKGSADPRSPLDRFFGWCLGATRDYRNALQGWGHTLPIFQQGASEDSASPGQVNHDLASGLEAETRASSGDSLVELQVPLTSDAELRATNYDTLLSTYEKPSEEECLATSRCKSDYDHMMDNSDGLLALKDSHRSP